MLVSAPDARAHVDLADRRRPVAVREIDHRRRRLAERVVERGLHHAGDRVLLPARLDPAADRIAAVEVAAHEFLVDDRLERRGFVAQLDEVAARDERQAHHGEVSGRHRVGQRLVRAVGAAAIALRA